MRRTPLHHRQPLVTVLVILMLGLQVENSTWSINIKSTCIVLGSLVYFSTLYRSKLVVMVAYTLGVSHVDRLFGFDHVFRRVAFIKVQLVVFEHNKSSLPIGEAHVCLCSLLEYPPTLIIVTLCVSLWLRLNSKKSSSSLSFLSFGIVAKLCWLPLVLSVSSLFFISVLLCKLKSASSQEVKLTLESSWFFLLFL